MTDVAPPQREGLHVRPFDAVLVANRGEIAVRVIRSARAAGYRTVAVFSDADADAPHVALADEAVRLGPAPAAESYLDIDKVIAAAQATGAQAVHPGYGFLAENARFARACAEADLVFVGPPPDAIAAMGDKAAAKRLMADAGVPQVPGYAGTEQSDERLVAEAEKIGFPLMVKASAGGGGKGMRLVQDASALTEAIAAARREATGAFGDDTLLLERALTSARHVEIQILSDAHGHVIALGERDCSVQRRHQKVVEEAPSPALTPEIRTAMQQAAVEAARSISYVGAGTVEFLYQDEDFFFLEMNTRLQVEHPVTELVTGLDLVDWQLRIASGEALTVRQEDVALDGHAIEVRLYAEDPANGYLPQTGPVVEWLPPDGTGIRVDAGIGGGLVIGGSYDPMLAKIVAHGRDRDEARRRLIRALEATLLLGVTTNRAFLAALLRHPVFAAGEATTTFLADHTVTPPALTARDVAALAASLYEHEERAAGQRSPGLAGWTNGPPRLVEKRLRWDGVEARALLRRRGDRLQVRVGPVVGVGETSDAGEETYETFDVSPDGPRVLIDGRSHAMTARRRWVGSTHRILAALPAVDVDMADVLLAPTDVASASGAGVLTAPMHGAVVAAPAAVGDRVQAGDAVVVVEAMKMEHVVLADVDGEVAEIAEVGTQVADGQVLARITSPPESERPPGEAGAQD